MLIPSGSVALALDGILVAAPTLDSARRVAAAALPGARPDDWHALPSGAFYAPSAILMFDATAPDEVRILDASPSSHPYHVDRDDLHAISDALRRPVHLFTPEAR